MMERAAAQTVISEGQVPEDIFWFATQVLLLCFLQHEAPLLLKNGDCKNHIPSMVE